jgi:MIP family channel proteins
MPKLNAILCELVGTLLLVVIVSAASVANTAVGGQGLGGEAVANGLVVAVIVTATLNISGGQVNPAVTIALFTIGKIQKKVALVFIGAQVLGAALGGLFVQKLLPVELANRCLYGTPHLHPDLSIGQGIWIEILATFVLGFSICGTVLNNKVPIQTGGFGIGAAVAFLVYAFGPLTGAAMNPARQLGSALAAGHWDHHWLYWVGPVIGAILALQLCTRLFGKGIENPKSQQGKQQSS